jgi:predicted exporter
MNLVRDWTGYVEWISNFSPVPLMTASESKVWLVDLNHEIEAQFAEPRVVYVSFAASPMSFYESVLTQAQKHMLILLAIALGVMALFLRPLQRSWTHVMQIVMPLIAALAILRWVLPSFAQDGVNLVHVAGLFFIMTVALDYSSIAVSSRFHADAISKLALTGALSFVGFASLLFASHPMVKSLGLTVALGIAVSWVFGVCIRLRAPALTEGVHDV